MTTEYIAVVGNGSMRNGETRTHAADPEARETEVLRPTDPRWRSLCGQRYMFRPTGHGLFADVMHLDQCQRCVRIVAKRKEPQS